MNEAAATPGEGNESPQTTLGQHWAKVDWAQTHAWNWFGPDTNEMGYGLQWLSVNGLGWVHNMD